MIILRTIDEFNKWRSELNLQKKVGFVPTMGALHIGHETLLKFSKKNENITVLSIFVNPTQFNQKEDFENYPKTESEDLRIAERNGVDAVFIPNNPKELYPDDYRFSITENKDSLLLCGAHRPGHFNGVLSVVMKLLQIVKPHSAYFGEKDYQQYKLISDMSKAYFLSTDIVPLPTVRLESGLAFSSRNKRLTNEGLVKASEIYKALRSRDSIEDSKKALENSGFQVEYLEEQWGRRFIAAWFEGVRLIDNVVIEIKR